MALSPADSWVEHGYLLADYYRFGRSTADDETNYLFIVGGADVIPMPVLPQYISDPDYSDTDIDSDIPYAYLLGERTYPMLGTAEIFQYEQYFHTGRLPLAHDASLDDLAGYLRRAAKAPGSMAVGRAYGQTDLTWLSASASVSEPFRRNRLFRGDMRLDERIYTQNLLSAPASSVRSSTRFSTGVRTSTISTCTAAMPRPHAASMLPTSSNVTRQSRPGSWRPPRNRTWW